MVPYCQQFLNDSNFKNKCVNKLFCNSIIEIHTMLKHNDSSILTTGCRPDRCYIPSHHFDMLHTGPPRRPCCTEKCDFSAVFSMCPITCRFSTCTLVVQRGSIIHSGISWWFSPTKVTTLHARCNPSTYPLYNYKTNICHRTGFCCSS